MKIAVTYENGSVFQHFGHTEQFKVYDISDGKIESSAVFGTNGSGHGALAGLLSRGGINTLICGGIGAGAKQALAGAGIELFGGVTGDADKAVSDYLSGKLGYDPDIECNNHGHTHGDTCADHDCTCTH